MIKNKLPRKVGGNETTLPIDYEPTEESKKCSPAFKLLYGSCINLEILVEMAKAYNGIHINDVIQLREYDPNNITQCKNYKIYLLNKFSDKLGREQQKWITQPFIKQMDDKHQKVLKLIYRPVGPAKTTRWLNQKDIDDVLNQYEILYPEFKYLGCVPADHQNLNDYLTFLYKDLTQFEKDKNNGIYKYSYVTNTDTHDKSGQHWRCLLFDTRKLKIYFIDSVGNNPIKEDMVFINLVEKYMTQISGNTIKVQIGKKKHQKSNTECGMYGLYFTIKFLEGKTFDDFETTRVPDDEMIKLRNEVFSVG